MAVTESHIQFLRQSGWDLWVAICIIACVVLVSYALLVRLWQTVAGWIALGMIAFGVTGTVFVAAVPAWHTPEVGLWWTLTLLVLLSCTFYLNLHEQLGTGKMLALLALRIVALAMLVPMFFEPVWFFVSKPKPEIPVVFVMDTSGSMSFQDVPNGPSRIQSVWQTLRPQMEKVNEHFLPHFYTFSTRDNVKKLAKLDELVSKPADGKATDLAAGLEEAVTKSSKLLRAQERKIVLISDGIHNASPEFLAQIRRLQMPIYTVRVGSEQAQPTDFPNVAVDNVEVVGGEMVVRHESKLRATVKSTALANRVVEVEMGNLNQADGKGNPKKVAGKTLVLQAAPEGQVVDLAYTPQKVGIQKLRVWIKPVPGERTTADNQQEIQDLALDPRIKVLYIEGRVRPEYTQLNRAGPRSEHRAGHAPAHAGEDIQGGRKCRWRGDRRHARDGR